MVSYATGGGTGSGMGAEFLEKLKENYPDMVSVTPMLLPSQDQLVNVLEIYNTVLTMHYNIENAVMALPFDYNSLQNYSKHKGLLTVPSKDDTDSILNQTLLNYTSSQRYQADA